MKRFLVLQQSGGKLTGSVRRDGSVTAVSAKAALEVCVNMMEDAAGVHRVGVPSGVETLWVVEVGEVRCVTQGCKGRRNGPHQRFCGYCGTAYPTEEEDR